MKKDSIFRKALALLGICASLVVTSCDLSGGSAADAAAGSSKLKALVLKDSAGADVTITPAFKADVYAYTASIPASSTFVKVGATAEDAQAQVKVDGALPVNGFGTSFVRADSQIVEILVDGNNLSLYKITLTRAVDNAPTAGELTIGTVSATSVALSWTAGTDDYTAAEKLAYKVVRSEADITADNAETGTVIMDWSTNTLAATAVGLNKGVKYNFGVLVKDLAGKKALYAVKNATTVLTASSEAHLTALTLSAGALEFKKDTLDYTIAIKDTIPSIRVTPSGAVGATIKVNDAAVKSGTSSGDITVTAGTKISIVVTAEDGVKSTTYTLTVSRPVAKNYKIHFRPENNWGITTSTLTAVVDGVDYPMTLNAVTTWTPSDTRSGWYSTAEISGFTGIEVAFHLKFTRVQGATENFEVHKSGSTATDHIKISALPDSGNIWVDRHDWIASPSAPYPGWAKARSVTTGATPPNDLPVASSLVLSKTLGGASEQAVQPTDTLYAAYTYRDEEDEASTSTIQWMISSDAVQYTDIAGATTSTLAVSTYEGKRIKFKVTPSNATSTGVVKFSDPVYIGTPNRKQWTPTMDGTKDVLWSDLFSADVALDPAGDNYDLSSGDSIEKIYAANDGTYLYVYVDMDNTNWGKDVAIFFDVVSDTAGKTNLNPWVSSWDAGYSIFTANTPTWSANTIEGAVHANGGRSSGYCWLDTFVDGTPSRFATFNDDFDLRGAPSGAKSIELKIKLSRLNLSVGSQVKIFAGVIDGGLSDIAPVAAKTIGKSALDMSTLTTPLTVTIK